MAHRGTVDNALQHGENTGLLQILTFGNNYQSIDFFIFMAESSINNVCILFL